MSVSNEEVFIKSSHSRNTSPTVDLSDHYSTCPVSKSPPGEVGFTKSSLLPQVYDEHHFVVESLRDNTFTVSLKHPLSNNPSFGSKPKQTKKEKNKDLSTVNGLYDSRVSIHGLGRNPGPLYLFTECQGRSSRDSCLFL